MTTRLVGPLVLVLAMGLVGEAQSLAELMQKAIYLEDTRGDLDAAIRVYQQIIAGAVPGTEVHAQAERRLEVARATRRTAPRVPRGIFDGRVYRNTRTGLTVNVPTGWTVHATGSSSDDGEMVEFAAPELNAQMNLWLIPETNDWTSLNRKLDESPAKKVEAFAGELRLRPASVHRAVINGKQAMVATADLGSPAQPMVQYMIWIYTENTHTYFFSAMNAADFERVKPLIDELVYAAVIP